MSKAVAGLKPLAERDDWKRILYICDKNGHDLHEIGSEEEAMEWYDIEKLIRAALPARPDADEVLTIRGVDYETARRLVDEEWGAVVWANGKCYPATNVTVEYERALSTQDATNTAQGRGEK